MKGLGEGREAKRRDVEEGEGEDGESDRQQDEEGFFGADKEFFLASVHGLDYPTGSHCCVPPL